MNGAIARSMFISRFIGGEKWHVLCYNTTGAVQISVMYFIVLNENNQNVHGYANSEIMSFM